MIAILAAVVVALMSGTGPENFNVYPMNKRSPYRLPWSAGVERWMVQGNSSFATHRGKLKYSYDFWMPVGTPVLAAREGRVTRVVEDKDGIGFYVGNHVIITHEDGTHAVYSHLRKTGVVVELNQLVRRGDHIAYSGMVGKTLYPHLHFHVLDKARKTSIPISFFEVKGGVPLTGRKYKSANR